MGIVKRIRYWFVVGVKYLMTGRTRLSEEDANRNPDEISEILRAKLRNLFVDRQKTNRPQLWHVDLVDQYGYMFNFCHRRPGALAEAILGIRDKATVHGCLAEEGHRAFQTRFTSTVQGEATARHLLKVLED